jgi:small nuclear ribonucleoprotein (snRNP)-like protein
MRKSLHLMMLSLFFIQPLQARLEWSFDKEAQEIQLMIDQLQQKRMALGQIESVDHQKNAVLKNIQEVLTYKNRQIFEYMNLNRDLQRKIQQTELSFTERLQTELQRRKITKGIDQYTEQIDSLEQQLLAQNSELENLKSFIRDQDTNHQESLERMNTHIQQLSHNLARMPASGQDEIDDSLAFNKKLQQIRSLQAQLEKEANLVNELKKQNNIQSKSFQQLVQINNDLSAGLDLAERQIEFLRNENSKLQHHLAAKESTIHELKRQSLEHQKQIAWTEHQLLSLLPSIDQSSSGRMPASQKAAPWIYALKDAIIDESFEATLRPDGSVSVSLAENYLFNFGQTQLDHQHKIRLLEFFKTYAQTLFGDQDLKDKLLAIEFIGHSSPWFQNAFVNPFEASSEAYIANLHVSLQRAQTMANFIFSEHFGDFPYKEEMRALSKVSGRSFSDPIPLRTPASSNHQCGGFDCRASRRVEIVFSFEPWTEEEFTR